MHRFHYSDLKELGESRTSDTCLLDIRPELQYSKKHIRHAINVVPDNWRNHNVDDFIDKLRELKIHILIRFFIFEYAHRTDHSFKHLADQVKLHTPTFTFVIIKPDNLDSTKADILYFQQLLDDIADSKTKVKQLLYREEFENEKLQIPKIDVRITEKSYEDMPDKYESLFVYDLGPAELGKPESKSNCPIKSIIPHSVYLGESGPYFEFTEKQAAANPEIIYKQRRDVREYEEDWQSVSTVFYTASEPPVIPEGIRLNANLSQSFGERVVYEEQKMDGEEFTKKRKMFAHKLAGFRKSKKIRKKLQVDENLMQNHYSYDNGFEFTWNVTICPHISQLQTFMHSVATFMEASSNMQSPFLVCQGDHAITSLLYYFLIWRRWSVRRSFRYLFHCVGDCLLDSCRSPFFLDGLDLVLREEASILPHAWPSVSFTSFITFSLKQEPNLATNVSLFKNPFKAKERELFTSIRDGETSRVKELLEGFPFLATARTSCRRGAKEDLTPILQALVCSNSTVRRDVDCLKLMATPDALPLSSLNGHDVLYHAIEIGDEMVHYFLSLGTGIHRCSVKLRMNPLQRAIKFQLNPGTLVSLMNRYTVNHRDSYQRTPALYIVETYSSKIDVKKTLLTELVLHGADLFLQDLEGRTVVTVAAERSSELAKYVHELINQEGTIRHPPFHSFAKKREKINVEYFIDGENTYLAMAETLRAAKRTIYIADWWLTPQAYLDRRSEDPAEWEKSRLDNVLLAAAMRGVEIRVMLWDNVEAVESLGSSITHSYLESLHKNILVVRHSSSFVAGLSHHQKIIIVDHCIAFVGGLDICAHRWDKQSHPVTPTNQFPGKDYFNPRYITSSDDLNQHETDYKLLSERKIARMGWHDVSFRVDGLAAFDVCVNYVQRWNFIKKQQSLQGYPMLLHPSAEEVPSFDIKREGAFESSVHITRSVGKWSIGFNTREQSIFNAVKFAITTSETYVYIETQFFISIQQQMEASEDPMSLSDVIVNRVRRAVREGKPFKCIIVLPMFPEGNPLEDSITLRIMYWQLQTIQYIEQKIREMTQAQLTGPSDYVNFYSIVNCALIGDVPQLEQIYVHAKLLITDNIAICGSANLNMRSLMGDRDSEICVVVENPDFCETLRRELWAEHLGSRRAKKLTGNCLKDFRRWDSVARKNSKYYKNFFEKSTPIGGAKTCEEFIAAEKLLHKLWESQEVDSEKAYTQLRNATHGHLIKYPRHFLHDDVMSTDRFKHSIIDILNPLTPLHFLANMKEAAVFTFVEYLVQ